MKNKISTGIWFIFFGSIVLLDNFNIIDFNFYAIMKYWPLMIVSVGISLIFQHKNYGTAVIVFVNLAICIVLAVVGYTSKDNFNWVGKSSSQNVNIDTSNAASSIHVPYSEDFDQPEFVFNVGAAAVKIDSATSHILEAKSGSKNLNFNVQTSKNDIELNAIIGNKKAKDNSVHIALNTQPLWDLTFNVGAAKFEADLRNHKVSRMEMNSGAANVHVTLGQPTLEEVKLEINTAASNCKISIPKDAACAIEVTTILSNNKLPGFSKKNGVWQTNNYETATKKYLIEVNGAANSLKIDRY